MLLASAIPEGLAHRMPVRRPRARAHCRWSEHLPLQLACWQTSRLLPSGPTRYILIIQLPAETCLALTRASLNASQVIMVSCSALLGELAGAGRTVM